MNDEALSVTRARYLFDRALQSVRHLASPSSKHGARRLMACIVSARVFNQQFQFSDHVLADFVPRQRLGLTSRLAFLDQLLVKLGIVLEPKNALADVVDIVGIEVKRGVAANLVRKVHVASQDGPIELHSLEIGSAKRFEQRRQQECVRVLIITGEFILPQRANRDNISIEPMSFHLPQKLAYVAMLIGRNRQDDGHVAKFMPVLPEYTGDDL